MAVDPGRKTRCVVHRTGDNSNFRWYRSEPMSLDAVLEAVSDVRRKGIHCYWTDYDLSVARGLPSRFHERLCDSPVRSYSIRGSATTAEWWSWGFDTLAEARKERSRMLGCGGFNYIRIYSEHQNAVSSDEAIPPDTPLYEPAADIEDFLRATG